MKAIHEEIKSYGNPPKYFVNLKHLPSSIFVQCKGMDLEEVKERAYKKINRKVN